jgi:hypothetical protein
LGFHGVLVIQLEGNHRINLLQSSSRAMLNSAGRDQSHLRERTARFLPSQESHLLAASKFYYSASSITRTNSLPVCMLMSALWIGLARQILIISGGMILGGGVDGGNKPPTTVYTRLTNDTVDHASRLDDRGSLRRKQSLCVLQPLITSS